jgi:ADP-dependent glucokinase
MALSKPQEIFLTPQKMDESFSKSILGLADGRINLNPEKPVSCWEEVNSSNEFLILRQKLSQTIAGDAFKICVAPVLVCRNVKQTAGGGDNISGAGLLVQL